MEMLKYQQLDTVYTIGDGPVSIVRVEVPALLVGKTVNNVTIVGETQVVSIARGERSLFIPTLGTIIQAKTMCSTSPCMARVRASNSRPCLA